MNRYPSVFRKTSSREFSRFFVVAGNSSRFGYQIDLSYLAGGEL